MKLLPPVLAAYRVADCWFLVAPSQQPCGLAFDRRGVRAADVHDIVVSGMFSVCFALATGLCEQEFDFG
jgi:hypothetical protein